MNERNRYGFLGDCDGNFVSDPVNDQLFLGLVHGRKLLFGDFNEDQYVDFLYRSRLRQNNPSLEVCQGTDEQRYKWVYRN